MICSGSVEHEQISQKQINSEELAGMKIFLKNEQWNDNDLTL